MVVKGAIEPADFEIEQGKATILVVGYFFEGRFQSQDLTRKWRINKEDVKKVLVLAGNRVESGGSISYLP